MTLPIPEYLTPANTVERQWLARLNLRLEQKHSKTILVKNEHIGPLRVQRPFYPEAAGCCHVYLLHPPGGLVLGDLLHIEVDARQGTQALLTTPSAGKIYGVQDQPPLQQQRVKLNVADGAVLEWLPQETIVFDGANGRLHTRVDLQGSAQLCLWDMVCLGRVASGDLFKRGRCDQTLEVLRDGRCILLERNRVVGGDEMMTAPWGLNSAHSFGTFLATVTLNREQLDALLSKLGEFTPSPEQRWGVTQKGELLIVRYLGFSSRIGRAGFEAAWRFVRPLMCGREAVTPRIWNT